MHVEAGESADVPSNLSGRVSGDIGVGPAAGWKAAVAVGILGWVLDAFDFFVVVFLITQLANKFHVGKSAIVWSMTLTLAARPFGALIFGALADRYGRRRPLILCVVYFSTMTVLSGLAPGYWIFLAMRLLYGLGMGGYWGIGASYAMESAPLERRGVLSGVLQAGYPFGYLLAAVAMQMVAPRFGWQALFFVGIGLTVVIVVLALLAPESAAWRRRETPALGTIFTTLLKNARIFGYLLLLMTGMNCLSHGTQDLYPDFLKSLPSIQGATVLGMQAGLGIPVIYNVGAILGAFMIGALSERIGRRYAMMLALGLCLLAMPWWAFGGSAAAIVIGSYVMQSGVQGAYGVIPAHLNELSPDAVRGLFPGFVYQLGVLFSSPSLLLENFLRGRFGYSWALCSFELVVVGALFLILAFGPEDRGKVFV